MRKIVFLLMAALSTGCLYHKTHVVTCQLMSKSYKSKNIMNQSIPVVTGKVVFLDDSEMYTTVWECEEHGRIISRDPIVYRFARNVSNLVIKQKGNDIKIVGIEKKAP